MCLNVACRSVLQIQRKGKITVHLWSDQAAEVHLDSTNSLTKHVYKSDHLKSLYSLVRDTSRKQAKGPPSTGMKMNQYHTGTFGVDGIYGWALGTG